MGTDTEPSRAFEGAISTAYRLSRAACILLAVAVIASVGAGGTAPGTGAAIHVAGGVGTALTDGGAIPWDGGDGGGEPGVAQASGTDIERDDLDRDPGPDAVRVDNSRSIDTDRDGLTNAVERDRYGTDPYRKDTDGDGFTDWQEVHCTEAIPGADPLHQDVYVELDTTSGTTVDDAAIDLLALAYERAPIRNPDGERGIRLHVERSDTDLSANGPVHSHAREGARNDIPDFRETHFDNRREGHYYALAADEVAYRGDAFYAGAGRPGVIALETFNASRTTASLFMHELGHAFGLDAGQTGIDSKEYSVDRYESVMNYRGLYRVLTYSDGEGAVGRDEWAFVADDRHVPDLECQG